MMNFGTIWAFEPGRGSFGEAGWRGDNFLPKAFISTEFEKSKTSENELAGFVLETLLNRCIQPCG